MQVAFILTKLELNNVYLDGLMFSFNIFINYGKKN